MALRSNVCYRRLKRSYTRISKRVQAKNFITGVPTPKIHHFEAGKKHAEYDSIVKLVATENGQVRHNALEAMRVVSTRYLQPVGITNYHYQIPCYPHQVLRENTMATGAGADRFQEGMRAAFGKPIGTATQVFKNDTVLIKVRTYKKFVPGVKTALKKADFKIGVPCRIIVEQLEPEAIIAPAQKQSAIIAPVKQETESA